MHFIVHIAILHAANQPQEAVFMHQQKGFSLCEVLVSLVLMATTALFLVQQQWQSRLVLQRIMMRSGASHYLDQVHEALLIHTVLPTQPPYHLSIQKASICVEWNNEAQVLARKRAYRL